MFGLNAYSAPRELDQAYELLVKDKKNVILGGLLWMKMGKKQYHTGIDLKHLGLDQIRDDGDHIDIGAMVRLRQVEKSRILRDNFGPIFARAFAPIVGIQFRNLATMGGSVFGRFGFSDVITALMALDARVTLYKAGEMALADFLDLPRKRDILVNIRIPKKRGSATFQSLRKTATDFSLLNLGLARCDGVWRISVGGRPSKACLAPETAALLPENPGKDQIRTACDHLSQEVGFGTNARGSAQYRQAMVKVLLDRGIKEICR